MAHRLLLSALTAAIECPTIHLRQYECKQAQIETVRFSADGPTPLQPCRRHDCSAPAAVASASSAESVIARALGSAMTSGPQPAQRDDPAEPMLRFIRVVQFIGQLRFTQK